MTTATKTTKTTSTNLSATSTGPATSPPRKGITDGRGLALARDPTDPDRGIDQTGPDLGTDHIDLVREPAQTDPARATALTDTDPTRDQLDPAPAPRGLATLLLPSANTAQQSSSKPLPSLHQTGIPPAAAPTPTRHPTSTTTSTTKSKNGCPQSPPSHTQTLPAAATAPFSTPGPASSRAPVRACSHRLRNHRLSHRCTIPRSPRAQTRAQSTTHTTTVIVGQAELQVPCSETTATTTPLRLRSPLLLLQHLIAIPPSTTPSTTTPPTLTTSQPHTNPTTAGKPCTSTTTTPPPSPLQHAEPHTPSPRGLSAPSLRRGTHRTLTTSLMPTRGEALGMRICISRGRWMRVERICCMRAGWRR